MDSPVRQILVDLVGRDPGCGDEARRCEGILKDLCKNQNKKEILALSAAISEGVVADLRRSSGRASGTLVDRLVMKLVDDRGLQEDLARWAVESWAVAYGIPVDGGRAPQGLPSGGGSVSAKSPGSTPKKSLVEMAEVEGGSFRMGSVLADNEKPIHKVTLTTFRMGRHAVTVGEFRRFINATCYVTEAERGDGSFFWNGKAWEKGKDVTWENPRFAQGPMHPVVCVSWNDAVAYCRWLSEAEGLEPVYQGSGSEMKIDMAAEGYRLPTEAEWEYAAKGGMLSNGYTYAGSNDLDTVAWYSQNSGDGTHPVETKAPNELGLYDMTGNVWEWCQDWYGAYGVDAQENPTGASSGAYRVYRGGSWGDGAGCCRSAYRNSDTPGSRYPSYGFRLVRRP